jgi:diaminohydroxyphosphoribosylaminopyrimidine deaminase/5-amino-6-(5-phosphoribosylamino)uracil reductase
MSDDESYMRRALQLAEKGRGYVEPNPLVGCVIVRSGEVVGEGYHARFGEAHAEVNALQEARERARGATMYVTLEPCCHHGKTPPCSEAIIAAGIRRVVLAMKDPDPRVSGRGIEQLREAGIVVRVGVLESEAQRLNAPYLKLLQQCIPYVHAKWAMSLDGKIATAARRSRWISSPESRAVAHTLRGRMDAIVVGIHTVLADDPLLTARPPGPRVAVRIVLDSHARLSPESRLVQSVSEAPVLVATGPDAEERRLERLRAAGCECVRLSQRDRAVRVRELLKLLGERKFTNVLVEGGAEVLGSFFVAGEVDEVHVFVAPLVLGGTAGLSAVGGPGFAELHMAPRFELLEVLRFGPDVYLRALRRYTASNHY